MDLSGNQFNGLLPTKYLENLMAMKEAHTDGPLASVIGETYYQDSVIVVMKDYEYQLVKILSIFTTLDFSRNNFEGEIPNYIGKLISLKGLNFSHNKLAGHIPPSLGDLSNLEWLDLSSNELVGVIPQELADLTSLSFLNLSHNKLEGPIPIGKQFNTFNNDSYFGNLGLCGFPLEQCSKHEAQEQGDQEEDTIELDWKIVMMGFGSGLVIGISIGYMVLTSPKVDYWFMERFGGGWQARSRRKRRN